MGAKGKQWESRTGGAWAPEEGGPFPLQSSCRPQALAPPLPEAAPSPRGWAGLCGCHSARSAAPKGPEWTWHPPKPVSPLQAPSLAGGDEKRKPGPRFPHLENGDSGVPSVTGLGRLRRISRDGGVWHLAHSKWELPLLLEMQLVCACAVDTRALGAREPSEGFQIIHDVSFKKHR